MSIDHERSRDTLKWLILTGTALLLFLLWIEGAFVSKTSPGLQEEAAQATPTETYQVKRQETEDTIAWPARIAALKEIDLAPKFQGRIMEISVIPGATVRRGQVLVRLDSNELDARLAQARAQLAAAEADAARAGADANRLRHLHQKEAATRQSLDMALADERHNSARVLEMRNLVRQAEAQLAETSLRAPFDGVIDRRLAEPGDMALPGQPILRFLEMSGLTLEVNLPASCAQGLAQGEEVRARTRHGESRPIEARIDEISPANDPATDTVRVKARLLDEGIQDLVPGTFVWLERACGSTSMILIPGRAVTRIGQLESVRVLQDNRVKVRHVRTGRRFGEWIEVLSGLDEGEELVTGGP